MRNPASLVVLGALCARLYPAEPAPAQAISVLVFNYAGIPARILEQGIGESRRIMQTAGVDLMPVTCTAAPDRLALDRACREAPGPLTVVLHILPRGATTRHTEAAAFGFAVPPESSNFGSYAGVFPDRIEQLGGNISQASALGHVIAHELGHLLLETGHHSAGGIMKADWRHEQLELAAQGALRFGKDERRLILRNLRRRILAEAIQLQASTVSPN